MDDNKVRTFTKQGVISSLGKEKLTMWDIETLLGFVFTHLKSLKEPNANTGLQMFNPVSTAIEDDIKLAIQKVAALAGSLTILQDKISDQLDKSYNATEKKYNATIAKFQKLAERAEKASIQLPVVNIPHSYNASIELAERLSNMSDSQIDNLIKISNALKESK